MRELFWLKQDTRNHVFEVDIPDSVISVRDRLDGNVASLKQTTILNMLYSAEGEKRFDVHDRGIFMVSKKVKEVFEIFCPDMEYREIFVVDSENKRQQHFYAPLLPFSSIECKITRPQGLNGERQLEIFGGKELMGEVFRVRSHMDSCTVVSLFVAEAILRIGCKNVQLIPVRMP